jgi:hypothetical protein
MENIVFHITPDNGKINMNRSSGGIPWPAAASPFQSGCFLRIKNPPGERLRDFAGKLRALDAKAIRSAAKGSLTGKEIDIFLGRRDLILKQIEDLIRDRGEADVLY